MTNESKLACFLSVFVIFPIVAGGFFISTIESHPHNMTVYERNAAIMRIETKLDTLLEELNDDN